MSDGWVVQIAEQFVTNTAQVVVWRQVGDSRVETFAADGTRRYVTAGEAKPDDVGFPIPLSALPALRDAIDDRNGRRPSDAVADVLKESLAVERDRVDRILRVATGETTP